MTLAGERIQALFSELTLEDHSGAPRFEKVWKRAEICVLQPKHTSIRSLVLITTAAVAIAVLSATWLLTKPKEHPVRTAVSDTPNTEPAQRVTEPLAYAPPKSIRESRGVNTSAARRRALLVREGLVRKAAIISSWQSPTEIFMESPASSVMNSVPQLNQSVKDLESFLPNNEVKESPK